MSQLKKKAIPYSQIMEIIRYCPDSRTQALIAFQYGFATRAGELAKEYNHYYYKYSNKFEPQKYISEGPKNKHFAVKNDGEEITFLKPNFKQAKLKNSDGEVRGVDRFVSFVIKCGEPYLFSIIHDWVKQIPYNEPVFNLKQAMVRRIIDKQLKLHDSDWSSHWLRQSRAWHIGEATGDPYAVQAVLGHGDLNTSLKYVSGLQVSLRKLFVGGKTMEDYLGGVIE